jgi:aspartate-semialdehyde dehydrogenase
MRLAPAGYRVAIVGASSLLGQELLTVLEERSFPVSRLIKYEAGDEEPDLPIVDLRESLQGIVADQDVSEEDLDFAFLAVRPQQDSSLPAFLRRRPSVARGELDESTGTESPAPRTDQCTVIDLDETLAEDAGRVLSVPFLEPGKAASRPGQSRLFVSPHPAAILISTLLLRLANRFKLERAVAQVFEPVSEIGPRAIEELQKQTINLLTFQKIPRQVFGNQLAFNLLPRIRGAEAGTLNGLERHVRQQLREYLTNRVPVPALRLFHVPVFYSLALSIYVETAKPEPRDAVAGAIEGKYIHVRRVSQPAPSQVEATGSRDILVDTIISDPERPTGIWLWAVADNLRLAAVNAVEIAERLNGIV